MHLLGIILCGAETLKQAGFHLASRRTGAPHFNPTSCYDTGGMITRDLRFALDEKGIKSLAPTLVGKPISFWEDTVLRHGYVSATDVKRDRYGNPYIEVQIEEAGATQPAA